MSTQSVVHAWGGSRGRWTTEETLSVTLVDALLRPYPNYWWRIRKGSGGRPIAVVRTMQYCSLQYNTAYSTYRPGAVDIFVVRLNIRSTRMLNQHPLKQG